MFQHHSGVILGGQMAGDISAGEIIHALSACIQSRMTANQIATFQMGTHPALTAAPFPSRQLSIQNLRWQRGNPLSDPSDPVQRGSYSGFRPLNAV